MKDMAEKFDLSPGKRKRARPPEYSSNSVNLAVPKVPKVPRPPASQPANHDIAGYMPGRKDFDTQYENDAEQIVKDIEFAQTDTPEDTELKSTVLRIYNSVLDERERRKDFIFSRNLTDFRKIQSIEKKRPKDEKELLQKYRVFARMQTEDDFELFIDGLLKEQRLRSQIAQYQEYLRVGVETIKESLEYEKEKSYRVIIILFVELRKIHG
jgi:transcriptional adapter 2-alpha